MISKKNNIFLIQQIFNSTINFEINKVVIKKI